MKGTYVRKAIPASADSSRRLRRICARVLMVAGGAVAGTAVAWALSTATASASTTPDTSPAPSTAAYLTTVPATQVDRAVSHFTEESRWNAWLDRTESTGELPTALISDRRATEKVASAIVDGLGQTASQLPETTQQVVRPVAGTVNRAAQVLHDPVGGLQQASSGAVQTWQHLTAPLGLIGASTPNAGQVAAGAPVPLSVPQFGVAPVTSVPLSHSNGRGVTTAEQRYVDPIQPYTPAPRQPFVPDLVPGFSVTGGQSGSGSGGSPLAGATTDSPALPDVAGDWALRSTTEILHGLACRQPGTDPD